jgi:hypothetical protein
LSDEQSKDRTSVVATSGVTAAVLTKALPKARARPVSQSVRADTRNAKALSAFATNFPWFEEEVDPARRPVAKASQIRERSRPAEARAQPIDEDTPIEKAVSSYLSAMPCLWIGIDDEPGPGSLRGVIERNAISLLSNFGREPVDPVSPSWLGRSSDRELVCGSGLWNQRHVEEAHDPSFLGPFENLVDQTAPRHAQILENGLGYLV